MVKIMNQYQVGDMKIIYYLGEETRQVGMTLLPSDAEPLDFEEKTQKIDSFIQVKYTGDTYLGGYAGGVTLRQGESVEKLKYRSQEHKKETDREEIITTMYDERGYFIKHHLIWWNHEKSIEVYSEFSNESDKTVTLEMLSSFSLGSLSPLLHRDAHDTLKIHRIRGVWSMEGRVESRSVEELQLEPSWAGHAVRCERFGQVGSMPANRFSPFLAVEDTKNQITWGVQIAHNASWQIEMFRKDDALCISGGLADREFGHWMKNIEAGEIFITPKAILSVCKGGLDEVSQRITLAGKKYLKKAPEIEQELPIVFNEYCTTWGCPSHENIAAIVDRIKGKGFSYFVIDCGWYKQEGVPWDITMGDYEVSKDLFKKGLLETVNMIKKAGMKPGIWFEIDNVGSASEAYQKEEHLLKRDGKVLTTTMRRFWDMRDPFTETYLSEKVIGTLLKYGFEYLKIDYNDTIGIGCDGAESLGEGLRENMEASLAFIRKIKKEVPDILIENCASGGHKLEPLMMSETHMSSFSDAHECEEIPIIAANLHRVILPCQSQIWAVIRKEDSLKRVAYSIINTFLGRMCISGDVLELKKEQWDLIESGMQFYKRITNIIKEGRTQFFGTKIGSYRHPEGWQGILRIGTRKEALVIIHTFHSESEHEIRIPLPKEYQIEAVYSDSVSSFEIAINISDLSCTITENKKAVAILLKEKQNND